MREGSWGDLVQTYYAFKPSIQQIKLTNMLASAPTAGDWQGDSKYAGCLQIEKNLHIDNSNRYEAQQYPKPITLVLRYSAESVKANAYAAMLHRSEKQSNQTDNDSRQCNRKAEIKQHFLKCLRNAIL